MIKFGSKHSVYEWKWCNAPDLGIGKMLEL